MVFKENEKMINNVFIDEMKRRKNLYENKNRGSEQIEIQQGILDNLCVVSGNPVFFVYSLRDEEGLPVL